VLNPNCSELVSHLGPKTKREIMEAIEKINAEDNLQIVFTIECLDPEPVWLVIPIPQGKEREVVKINVEEGLTIDLDRLLSFYSPIPKQVKDMVERHKADKFKYWGSISVLEGSDGKIKLRKGWAKGPYLRTRDSYTDRKELNISPTQHCTESEFPVFHRVREMFGGDYIAYDGGSIVDYEAWMQKNSKKGGKK